MIKPAPQIGLPRNPLPKSEYKSRLAAVFAAKAVVQTAHPQIAADVLQVSVVPRGSAVGRVDSRPSERDQVDEVRDWAESMSLVALHLVGRAAEEELFGEEQASLLTAKDVQEATKLASDIVGQSGLYVSPTLDVAFDRMTFVESELDRWPAVRQRFDVAVRDTVDEAYRRVDFPPTHPPLDASSGPRPRLLPARLPRACSCQLERLQLRTRWALRRQHVSRLGTREV